MKILSHYTLKYFLCSIINLFSFCDSEYIFFYSIYRYQMLCSFFKNFNVYLEISSDLYSNSLILSSHLPNLLMALMHASFLINVYVCLSLFILLFSSDITNSSHMLSIFFSLDLNVYIQLFKCFCLIITMAGLSLGMLLYIEYFLSFMGLIFLLLCESYNF